MTVGKLMDVLQNGSVYHQTVPGKAFRRGPRCHGCEYEWGPLSQGIIVNLEPDQWFKDGVSCSASKPCQDGCGGKEQCGVCGCDIHITAAYGPRQEGKIRILFPSDSDEIAENPYLTPKVTWVKTESCPEWFSLPLTDAGNAKRLILLHGWQMRYVHGWGWLVYDGRRWLRDTVGAVMRFAKATVEAMVQSLQEAPVMDKTAAKEFAAHAFKTGSAGKLEAMIRLAESEPEVARRVEDFDQFPWLLCVRNGLVDTTTGQLIPHDPALNITQLSNVEYHPEAVCPRWQQFLEEVFLGDQAMIRHIQLAIGYTLTGETSEEQLFFCYGDGANGKSTLLETTRLLMGDYALHMPFEAFLNNGKINIGNAFANLPGKRFVTATEAGETKAFNEAMLKAATGKDTITGEHKYEASFNFKPHAKFWLASNHKPGIRGNDEGIWRRIALIPMLADIPDAKRDPRLSKNLEDELQGILAWAVRGAIEWWRCRPIKSKAPQVMREALEEYRVDNDSFGRFMEETFEYSRDPEAFETASGVLRQQIAWAKKNNEYPLNNRSLGERLRKWNNSRLLKKRGSAGINWHGLKLVHSHVTDFDGGGGAATGLDRY